MKLFKHFSKRAKLLTLGALVALTAVALVPAISKAGSGPDRPTKAYHDGVAGFDHVTFNSFTGVPGIGDERQFFNGKYPGSTAYSDPMPQVKDGDVLTLEVYVHNNADPALNASGVGIAKNTKVRVAIPGTTAKTEQATAYISAYNAQPQVVYDTLDFGSANGNAFKLSYVNGSAHIQGNHINQAISDSVVSSGATIGTDALNGQLKGCFDQMVYVTLQVKVSMPKPNFTLEKQVGLPGGSWNKEVTAKPGDTVSYQLHFKNTGATTFNDVVLRDLLPTGEKIVSGSAKIYTDTQNGAAQSDAIVANGGQDIGNYAPGGGAYFQFKATLPTEDKLKCGMNTLTNIGQAIAGNVDVTDTAVVKINKVCNPNQPVYSCDLFHVSSDNESRKVTIDQFNTTQAGGAKFKDVVINWGDKTNGVPSTLTTNTPIGQMHTYAADGTYKLTATAHFTVNGTGDVSADGEGCTQTITFQNGTTVPPVLPNTGAGNVIGIALGAIVAGTVAGRLFLSRKLSRR